MKTKEAIKKINEIISKCSETLQIQLDNGRAIRYLTFWRQELEEGQK
jgi:hypothetical protein